MITALLIAYASFGLILAVCSFAVVDSPGSPSMPLAVNFLFVSVVLMAFWPAAFVYTVTTMRKARQDRA